MTKHSHRHSSYRTFGIAPLEAHSRQTAKQPVTMSTPEALLLQYGGNIVPLSYNAGFVTLSYVVSLIGAASTLELINRRTSRNGIFNHLLLISAAVTMGGISIWCMVSLLPRARSPRNAFPCLTQL